MTADGEDMHPVEVLDRLDAICRLPDHYARIRHFMIEGCRLLPVPLPGVVSTAIDVATLFQAGEARSRDMDQARVDCWTQLGDRHGELTSPDVCAVRAVICLLDPKSDDAFLDASYFMDFALRAGANERALAKLLAEKFQDVANPPD